MKTIIEYRKVSNIPILDIYEIDIHEKRPILIMLHGGNSCKEKYIERAYEFVKKGFFVTLFDAYGHGELKNNNEILELRNTEGENIDKILRVYIHTSKYINNIIDSYDNNLYADSSRIGLMGVSMGAHTIYYHILKERNPRIKVAVSINGSPIWTSFVRRYLANSSFESINISDADVIKVEKYIQSIEPINYIENIRNLPLLMINGEKDELIPINNIRKSYNILDNEYKNKKLIKFVEFKDIGHIVTPETLEIASKWLKKYI